MSAEQTNLIVEITKNLGLAGILAGASWILLRKAALLVCLFPFLAGVLLLLISVFAAGLLP